MPSHQAKSGRSLVPKGRIKPALQPRERRFVDEVQIDMNVEAAAQRAGFAPGTGAALAQRHVIRAAIETALRLRSDKTTIQQDYVLRRWAQLVRADPRELIEYWRVACRYCWGVDHQFQYTDVELRDERQRHLMAQLKVTDASERVEFDERGGDGYTVNRFPMRGPDFVEFAREVAARQGLVDPDAEPNSDHTCPKCHGHGDEFVYMHDTRTLSPDAAALYLGVKQGGGRIEVLMENKSEARQMLARHLGLFPDNRRSNEDERELSDEALDAALQGYGIVVEGDFTDVSDGADTSGAPGGGETAPAGAEPA